MRSRLTIVGIVSLLAFLVYAALSWPLAVSWEVEDSAQQAYFEQLTWAPGWVLDDLTFTLTYTTPVLIQTVCALVAVWMAVRARGPELDRLPRVAFIWACAFAVTCLAAANVLQQDSWLSVVWGNMILGGVDPYVVPFGPEDTAGLPLDEPPTIMTYGPLWAGVIAALAAVSGGSGLIAWVLQKIVLLAFWIVCLICVRRLARPFGPRREAIATILMGWLPVGVHLTVAEAHNDVVMVALVLVALVAHRSWIGPIALSASVLAKYASAPLLPVALLYEWRTARRGLLVRIWPGVVLIALGALFVLSHDRLGETTDMRAWSFLDPADPLRLIGVPNVIAIWAMRLVFGGIAVVAIIRLWRRPSMPALIATELAVMAAVLFTVVNHVWPWFFVWVLPLAALVPHRPLSVFVLAAACVAPFTALHWWRIIREPFAIQLAATAMYGVALIALAVWLVRRRARLSRLRQRRVSGIPNRVGKDAAPG